MHLALRIALLSLPALVACGDKEEGEDEAGGTAVGENPSFGGNAPTNSGGTGGTSSTSGGGEPVEGYYQLADSGGYGYWTFTGTTTGCGSCDFAFRADFTIQEGTYGDMTVELQLEGYYWYTASGQYFGYGYWDGNEGYWRNSGYDYAFGRVELVGGYDGYDYYDYYGR